MEDVDQTRHVRMQVLGSVFAHVLVDTRRLPTTARGVNPSTTASQTMEDAELIQIARIMVLDSVRVPASKASHRLRQEIVLQSTTASQTMAAVDQTRTARTQVLEQARVHVNKDTRRLQVMERTVTPLTTA